MKNLVLILLLTFGSFSHAAVQTIMINAKVHSFDLKTVTLEILGEKYKLHRAKLGPDFKNLKAGDIFNIEVDEKFLKQ